MKPRPLACVLLSVASLIPCFWHARIQAGDLSSHLYNAWLVQLIAAGHAPGLQTVSQSTNVLFDWLLKALLDAFGPDIAQRVAVSLAVLVLVWGAFAFVCRVSRARPWHLFPIILMLAYGWVFRMGLFNFYVSLGLCLWALALAWDGGRRSLAAIPLLALAWTAHALPIAWAVSLWAYRGIADRLDGRRRLLLLGAALAGIFAARAIVQGVWQTLWLPQQFAAMAAITQVRIYGPRYLLLAAGLLLCWGLLLASAIRAKGAGAVFSAVPFHCCVLTAAAIGLLPDWIRLPGYGHAFVFLSERMSLALGICICSLVGGALARTAVRYGGAIAALVFFTFSWSDEAALNGLEDQIRARVATLPPGQRVVSAITEPDVATNPTTHLIDRACLGHCFNYGNYEPSSGQFRVRIAGNSPLVVGTDEAANRLQSGDYVVTEADLPLYQVAVDPAGKVTLRALAAGQSMGTTPWHGL